MEKKQQQGFTIIEVVLVLAIAGLIFLMVFLALPALQRSQRDSTRRSSVSYFASQVAQYQANNRGAIPTAGTTCPAAGGTVVSDVISIPPGRFIYAKDLDGNSVGFFETKAG